MGRKRRTERDESISYLRTIFWTAELIRRANCKTPAELSALHEFEDTDRQHWERYALGLGGVGDAWLARVDALFPGTAASFRLGPRCVFEAITGSHNRRVAFLESLLPVAKGALGKPEMYGSTFEDMRLRLIATVEGIDRFFCAMMFHLTVVKRHRSVGREFYAAYAALEALDCESAWEQAARRHWQRFLAATLVESDPFGNSTTFPLQIRIRDFEEAVGGARAAILAAESDKRFGDLIYIERPVDWSEIIDVTKLPDWLR